MSLVSPPNRPATFDADWLAARAAAAGLWLYVTDPFGPVANAPACDAPVSAGGTVTRVRAGDLWAPVTVDGRRLLVRAPASGVAWDPDALARWAADLHALHAARTQSLRGLTEVSELSEQLGNCYEELSLIYELGGTMNVRTQTPAFLTSSCEPTAEALQVRTVGVCCWDPRLGEIRPTAFGPAPAGGDLLADLDAALRARFKDGDESSVVLENLAAEQPDLRFLRGAYAQLLAVPIRRRGSTLGCVFAMDKDVSPEVFGTYNRGVFTSIDRKLLSGVAVHLGLFLENRRLFSDAESLMMGLLHSLVAAVDAKDAYTCGHSLRVAMYASELATVHGMDDGRCERVYLAGLLHDVGKIGIDDAVLRKPGKLTDNEFAQIKRHPDIGFRILQNVPQITDVLPGVLHHHERYDGRGYPARLAGNDIPELGRILCLADSFDAMTSSRTYRDAMPIPAAVDEIVRCAGSQFDPEFVGSFRRVPLQVLETVSRCRDAGGLADSLKFIARAA